MTTETQHRIEETIAAIGASVMWSENDAQRLEALKIVEALRQLRERAAAAGI